VVTNARPWNKEIATLQITGSSFSISGPHLPVVLSPKQSITLKISFTPKALGVTSGSVFVPAVALNIPLTGDGTQIGQLTIAPASLNFGSVDVGSTTTQPSAMTATGGSVTVSSAGSSNSQFSVSGVSFPLTIGAGKSVGFDVVFSPTKSGTFSGTVTFASNSSSPPPSESATGIGILPTHSVDLSWNSSTSPVVGYNVYRGLTSGVYSKINTALDPSVTYTDRTVASGVTYYYVATAVNSYGDESKPSMPVKVVIP
jgi:hypothetical protein